MHLGGGGGEMCEGGSTRVEGEDLCIVYVCVLVCQLMIVIVFNRTSKKVALFPDFPR